MSSSDEFVPSERRPTTFWEALRYALTNRRLIALYGLTFALALAIPLIGTLAIRKWRERQIRRKLKEREEQQMGNELAPGGTFNKSVLQSLRHFEMADQKGKSDDEKNFHVEKLHLMPSAADAENEQTDEGLEETKALLEKEHPKTKRKQRKKYKDPDPETVEGLKQLTEKGLHGKLATAQLRAKTQLLEEQMSDEDREKEQKAREDQLEAIFKMMEEQKEKFGINDKEELAEQLKMYSV